MGIRDGLVTCVVEFVILTVSVIIVIPIAFSAIGGPARLVSDTPVGFFDLFNEEYTLPFMLAFILYQTVYIGGNWSYVQRYTSVRDENGSARVAWLFTLLYLVSPFIWMIPPMIYRVLNPDLNGLGVEGAYMMLCKQVLPPGLIGLVLAGMISATSSKANTTINLAATVFATDLYRNALRRTAGDRELILTARLFTPLFGAATVGLALLIPKMGGNGDFGSSLASIAGGRPFAPTHWRLFSARPAARLEAPTTSTSSFSASSAASFGVWNSGPATTSKPRSPKAEETRFAPRSWPSWPILATSILGFLPLRRSIAETPSTRPAHFASPP